MPDDSLDKSIDVPPADWLGATGSDSAPDGSLGATGSASAPGEQSGADIRDELADHLELRATELALQGQLPEEAARLAVAQFGNVARIARQCWWIQQGDWVMKRVLITSAVVVLLLAIAAGFAMPFAAKLMNQQTELANQIKQISESMAALAKAQKAALPPAAAEPLEIRGRVYVGDPSRPAAGAGIAIWRLDDTTDSSGAVSQKLHVVRRVRADERGRFRSRALRSGDYCVSSALLDPQSLPAAGATADAVLSNTTGQSVQSGPIYLYGSQPPPEVALNVEFVGGSVEFELAKKFPETIPDGESTLPVCLDVLLSPVVYSRLLPNSLTDLSVTWPVTGRERPLSDDIQLPGALLSLGQVVPFYPTALKSRGRVGATTAESGAGAAAQPTDALFNVADLRGHNLSPGKYKAAAKLSVVDPSNRGGLPANAGNRPLLNALYQISFRDRTDTARVRQDPNEGVVEIEVKPEKRTRLRVDIPDNWQEVIMAGSERLRVGRQRVTDGSGWNNITALEIPLKITIVDGNPNAER